MPDDPTYVTNSAWLRTVGRVDAIDEIADQFERPVVAPAQSGGEAFWADQAARRRRPAGGWRSGEGLHGRSTQRAAS